MPRKDDIVYTCVNGTLTSMMIFFFRRGFVLKLAGICCSLLIAVYIGVS